MLLILLLAAAPTATAQQPERRLTPAPQPTVAVPRMTPIGPQRPDTPSPLVLFRPLPTVAPALSAPVVPGNPPAMAKPAPATPAPLAQVPVETAPAVQMPPPPPDRKPEPPAASAPPAPAKAEAPIQTATASPPPKAPAEAPRTTARRYVRTTDDVTLRAAPGRGGRIIEDLEPGVRLEVMGPAPDGWVHVGRNGRPLGYLYDRYVTEEPAGTTGGKAGGDRTDAKPAAPGSYAKASREDTGCALPDDFTPPRRDKPIPAGSTVRVLADANLRVAPACDAKVMDVLETGETVTVLGMTGSWYRVGRGGRALGYVGASLLEERGRR